MAGLDLKNLARFTELVRATRRDLLNHSGHYTPSERSGIGDPAALAQSFVAYERQRQAEEAHQRQVTELAMKISAAMTHLHLRGIDLSNMSLPEAGELMKALDIEHRDAWEVGGADPYLDDPDAGEAVPHVSLGEHEHWSE